MIELIALGMAVVSLLINLWVVKYVRKKLAVLEAASLALQANQLRTYALLNALETPLRGESFEIDDQNRV